MMSFDIDTSGPLYWPTLLLLTVMLGLLLWLTLRTSRLTPARRWMRLGLNVVAWLVLVAYVLQPTWPTPLRNRHTLLVADGVTAAFWRGVSDSLHVASVTNARTFRPDRFDSVTLVGQAFPPELLSHLSRQTLTWVPYDSPDQLQSIRWQAVRQQSSMQQVSGTLHSSRKQSLRLTYAGRTLDSVALPAGPATFQLRFPAFTSGPMVATLQLNRQPLDTIRFFTQPVRPLTYQFLLNAPDFESRTLADWLGRQGNAVQLETVVSKQINNRLTINRARAKPDVVITDPSRASDPAVRRAVADGRAVLFINLTDPVADCRTISRAVGGNWPLRKTANEPTVRIAEGLTALPFAFQPVARQFSVADYPVAVQPVGAGRVGISLLTETFPLKLSGDTLTYGRVWQRIQALLRPAPSRIVGAEGPVFKAMPVPLAVTSDALRPSATVRAGADTVALVPSPFNAQSAGSTYRPEQAGWQPVADSLAFYVDSTAFPAVRQRRVVQAYVAAHTNRQPGPRIAPATTMAHIPDGIWLGLFLLVLMALWVEPKWPQA